MAKSNAFIPSTAISLKPSPSICNAPTQITYNKCCTRTKACLPTSPEANPFVETLDQSTPLLPQATIQTILKGTILAPDALSLAYTSKRDGFDNEAFFDRLIPFGGVPSLILGKTTTGALFGGYAACGFAARDDYREATNPRSMFVFRVTDDAQILFAQPTDLVQYDFYDYAIRLGASLLGVPMNPKHILKSDMGTSSCRLPSGETSVFGDATLAKIQVLQVWVAQKYVEELAAKKQSKGKGFLASLFG